MTRVNAAIPPANLCDKHLLSEHYEIIRVRHAQISKQKPAKDFILNKGHVIFFKDKLGFIAERYRSIHEECLRRKFKVTDFSSSFEGYDLSGTYKPTKEAKLLLCERIIDRLHSMKDIKYYGKPISLAKAIKILER